MSYIFADSCYQYPQLPHNQPSCVPCKKKSQPTAKDFKWSKKPLLDMLERDQLMKIRINMENLSHDRKIHDNAEFKLKSVLNDAEIDLQNRRDTLKTMLEIEDSCYRQEIIDRFETHKSSRIDDMREKVKKLREGREIEQKKVVEEKLNLVFQEDCAEMRSLLSKRLAQEIAVDWREQMWEKRRLECEQQEEERMWTCLNLMDMNEKLKREEAYDNRRAEFSKKALEEMNKQMEFKKIKKTNLEKLAEKEREMIAKDLEVAIAEKAKEKEAKGIRFQKTKEHVKEMLETRNYYRDRKLKREEIVAREFLKKAVRELYVEQEDREKRKKDLMRAITIYRDYLRKWNCLENSKEDALQRFIDGVIEVQHQKVMASRKREHDQRRLLFENVRSGRQLQIEDLKRKNEHEEIERQKELDMLKDDWKQYLVEIEEEKAERQEKAQQYKSDLACQVAYSNLLKEREMDEMKRQDEMGAIEEKLFNHRLQKTLGETRLAMSNPHRQSLIGKDIRQCYRPV